MVNLEEQMELHERYQLGMSQAQIVCQVGLVRKTVRNYLCQPAQGYRPRPARAAKLDHYRSYLRQHWELGVHNARTLVSVGNHTNGSGVPSRCGTVIQRCRPMPGRRPYVRTTRCSRRRTNSMVPRSQVRPGESWCRFGSKR